MTKRGEDGAIETDGAQQDGSGLAKGTGACLTCGTALSLRVLGGEFAEERPRTKKKKKRRREEDGTNESGTPART